MWAINNVCVHEILDGSNEFIGNCIRGHSREILAKNLSTFCPCPQTLPKTDWLIWWKKFQSSTMFRKWHRYYWLFLARSTERIRNNKQRKGFKNNNSLARKDIHVNLGLKKLELLKKLVSLKWRQVLCTGIRGKIPWMHLRNWVHLPIIDVQM